MLDTQLLEKLEKVNFNVDIRNIHGIPSHLGRKIVRLDNLGRQDGDPLAIVGSRYKPITHISAFKGALETMEKSGLDFTDAELKVDSYENGAMAKMELLLPKHHEKVGSHDLYLKYVARNSYNMRWKFQSFFGWMNQVCFNTLVSGQKLAYSSDRHTLNFEVDSANRKIKMQFNLLLMKPKLFKSGGTQK